MLWSHSGSGAEPVLGFFQSLLSFWAVLMVGSWGVSEQGSPLVLQPGGDGVCAPEPRSSPPRIWKTAGRSALRISSRLSGCSWIPRVGWREQAICCLHCPRIAAGRRGSRVSKGQNWDGGRSLGLTLCVSVWGSMKLPALYAKVTRVGPKGRAGSRGARLDHPILALLCSLGKYYFHFTD